MKFIEVKSGPLRLVHGEAVSFELAETWLVELGGQLEPQDGSPPPPHQMDAPRGSLFVKHGGRNAARRFVRSLTRSPSRSLAAFRLGSVLHAYGVPTPRPLAAIERRRGPAGSLVTADLLLTEWMSSPDLAQALPIATDPDRENLLAAAAHSIALLHMAGCRHRDLKASNLLRSQDGATVLIADLDGARACRGGPSHRQRLRDLARFMTSLAVIEGCTAEDGNPRPETASIDGGEESRRQFLRHYFACCPDLVGNDDLRQRWQVRATAWMRSKVSRNLRRERPLS